MLYSIDVNGYGIYGVDDDWTRDFNKVKTDFDNIEEDYIKRGFKIIKSVRNYVFTAHKDDTVVLVEIVKV